MNNILVEKFFPLETDRLKIRYTSIEDIDMLMKLDKQELTQSFLGGIKNKSREERLQFLMNKINNSNFTLTVCLKDNTTIGFIELKNVENNEAELSYIFDEDYCNKGYCTEASTKVVEFAFKKFEFKKITAVTVENNYASIKVLEKLSFKLSTENKNQQVSVENKTTENPQENFLHYELWKNKNC